MTKLYGYNYKYKLGLYYKCEGKLDMAVFNSINVNQ